MMTTIIIIAAFLGTTALIVGLSSMFQQQSATAVEDRLDMLAGNSSAIAGNARKQPNLLTAGWDAPGMIEKLFSRFGNLRNLLEQADLNLPPSKFFIMTGVFAAVGAAICVVTPYVSPFFAPIFAGAFALGPFTYVVFKRKRRLAAFAKQMPSALELLSRALRAGHSLGAGFQLVADEMDAPLGPEFGRCFEEQNLGIPLDESLENMTARVPNLDLRFFATAVILQRQTGGDLAEILDKIGYIVRERFKILGQVQALTGEGRLSGSVLLALPPVLFVVMLRLNYDYVMMLFEDPMGKQMLAGAIVSQILGALVIKKIVDIKV